MNKEKKRRKNIPNISQIDSSNIFQSQELKKQNQENSILLSNFITTPTYFNQTIQSNFLKQNYSLNSQLQQKNISKSNNQISINNLINICTWKLQKNPKHKKALYIRATSFFKKANYIQAIKDCCKLLQIDHQYINAYYIRGCSLQKLGKINPAINDLSIVLSMNSFHVNAMLARASCYNRLGSFQKAIQDYSTALKLDQQKNQSKLRQKINKDQDQDLVKPYQNDTKFLMDTSLVKNVMVKEQNDAMKIKINSDKQKNQKFNLQINQKDKDIAQFYHSKGFQARTLNEFDKAIQYYSRAIEIIPSFKAYFNRGFAYDKINKFQKALQDYNVAISIEPQNAFTYYNKGITLDKMQKYQESVIYYYKIKSFTLAIKKDNKKPDFYHNRALGYRKLRQYQLAINDCDIALSLNPQHFKALSNKAFCFDKLSMPQKAEQIYIQALKLNSNNLALLYHYGCFLEKIPGKELDALRLLNEAIKVENNYPPVYNTRGLIFDRIENFQAAYIDFSKAIELDQKNPIFIHNRGCCLRNMGKLDQSLQDFQKALQLCPNNSIIYSNMGIVYRKKQLYQQAIQCYNNQIQIEGATIKNLNNRGYCLAKIGSYQIAIKDFSQSIAIQKNIQAYHNRGICYQRIREFKKAIKDFTSAIQLNENNANVYFNRGCCYDSLGELEMAITDYSKALQIDCKNNKI